MLPKAGPIPPPLYPTIFVLSYILENNNKAIMVPIITDFGPQASSYVN